jgi:hypothetical protein
LSTQLRLILVTGAALLLGACGPTRDPGKAIGTACSPSLAPGESSEECADGLCLALDTASGFCTRSCEVADDCPPEYACEAAGRYGRVCRKLTGCKSDEDCPAGHSCNAETGNCYIKVGRGLCSPCQDSAQCPQGGACFTALGSGEQFCTSACVDDTSCPLGFRCLPIPAGEDGASILQCVPSTGTCNFGKPLCAPCAGDAECGGPFDLCVRNVVSGEMFCGTDCDPKKNVCPEAGCDPTKLDAAENPECPSGFACTNLGKTDDPNVTGSFQCVPNSNTCANYCDAPDELGQIRQCGLGQECNQTTKSCGSATDGRQCSPCLDNDDCRSGSHPENRCIVNDCESCPFKGQAFCASPCADDDACVRSFGPGFVCKPVDDPSGPKNYCMPQRGTCSTGLGRLGDDCSTGGAEDCVAGVCLHAGTRTLCSVPCTADVDCADSRYQCCEASEAGYDCTPEKRTATGPKSGTGVCAPLGGLFGDDCTPGRPPCQTGTCLDLGTARVCTVPCAAGCPTGFACRKAESADGSSIDICFPGGGGKAGADCDFGPAACESGLCIRKDSGPICSQHCTQSSDCPEKWSCEPGTTVTKQSVNACIPPALL